MYLAFITYKGYCTLKPNQTKDSLVSYLGHWLELESYPLSRDALGVFYRPNWLGWIYFPNKIFYIDAAQDQMILE